MPKKYIFDLTTAEQKLLKKLTTTGKHAAYKIRHGRILLMANIQWLISINQRIVGQMNQSLKP